MPKPGDLLMGRYRILERLGSGGMATVHRARDERLERDVAVKVLLPNLADDPPTAARFEQEARSLAASSHPGVVAVFDVDAGDPATGREPFFVMELCRGGSLADRLAVNRRMDPAELVPILAQVADGLADLHRRGIVHRDIKPHNILFTDDRAKLADFGLALSDDGRGPSHLTTPGTTVGTLAYLAPEILGGDRASAASDIYALAVVAFVGLTGQPPRPASSMAELVAASGSPAPPISNVAPDLGRAFDGIVGAGLAVRPDDRPDALTFASGLAPALGRWTRDGGPARRSIAGAIEAPIGDPSLVGVARSPAGDPPMDDETTAMSIPVGATATIPVTAAADAAIRRPVSPIAERRGAPARSWLGRAIVVAALVLAAGAVLAGLTSSPSGGPTAPLATRSASPASATVPSASPSTASPSPAATPAPTADPARAALAEMGAAIDAARGGHDGLKGKEANDLQGRVGAVQEALDAGDRNAALDEARQLDDRVGELSDRLAEDQAARLRAASADLVQTLSG
jgi:hypothetical protein